MKRKITKKEFKKIIANLYKELKNYEYRADIIEEKIYNYKTNNVARIIPILSVRDELLYYFLCKILAEEIAINRIENTYGGWRLGNKIKLEEDAEIEYVYNDEYEKDIEAIRVIALYMAPFAPNTSAEAFRRLGLGDVTAVTDIESATAWGQLPAGNTVEVGDPLFPRLDVDELSFEE